MFSEQIKKIVQKLFLLCKSSSGPRKGVPVSDCSDITRGLSTCYTGHLVYTGPIYIVYTVHKSHIYDSCYQKEF